MSTSIKKYSEVIKIIKYEERFEYLRIPAGVGMVTFGDFRYLNQILYRTKDWRSFRNYIIDRDNGCDLAHEDHPIKGNITIHHIIPITKEMVINRDPLIFDPENVICVSLRTHNAIHYGDGNLLVHDYVERKAGDTRLW